MPRLLWPSWRWMTISGTPSRASSTACACRSSSALAAADEQRAAAVIEIGFGGAEGFLDAQPGAPEDHDQAAETASVGAVASGAHDGDDLLDLGWVRRVPHQGRPPRNKGLEPRHGRR
jgi:hypothetical protein